MGKPINLKIGILGDKGVGKTTYITTLLGVIANHRYNEIEVRYEDEKSAVYLKNNFNQLISSKVDELPGEYNNVKSTVDEYKINFDLFYKNGKREYHFKIEIKDIPGEVTNVEGGRIKSVIEFLSSCDAMLYFYSVTDKAKVPEGQSPFDLNLILTGLVNLEKSARKTQKPFILIFTKSDEILEKKNLVSDKVENLNKIIKEVVEDEGNYLIQELQRFVENFSIISISSYDTLKYFLINKNDKIKIHTTSQELIDFPNFDIAFPITYILNKYIKHSFWDYILKLFIQD